MSRILASEMPEIATQMRTLVLVCTECVFRSGEASYAAKRRNKKNKPTAGKKKHFLTLGDVIAGTNCFSDVLLSTEIHL